MRTLGCRADAMGEDLSSLLWFRLWRAVTGDVAVEGRPAHLRGWKEIAAYVHASERGVMRWEQSRRLPIHRVPGAVRDAVIAHPEELEAWLQSPNASGADPDPVAAESPTTSLRPAGGAGASDRAASRRWLRAAVSAGAGVLLIALLAGSRSLWRTPDAAAKPGFGGQTLGNDTTLDRAGLPTLRPGRRRDSALAISVDGGSRIRLGVAEDGRGWRELREGGRIEFSPRADREWLRVEVRWFAAGALAGPASPTESVVLRLEPNGETRTWVGPHRVDIKWITEPPGAPATTKRPDSS